VDWQSKSEVGRALLAIVLLAFAIALFWKPLVAITSGFAEGIKAWRAGGSAQEIERRSYEAISQIGIASALLRMLIASALALCSGLLNS